MIICIEVKASPEVWKKIDDSLMEDLGLRHEIFGEDQQTKGPKRCSLPENCFCYPMMSNKIDKDMVDNACHLITKIIREHWSGKFKVLTTTLGIWRAFDMAKETNEPG